MRILTFLLAFTLSSIAYGQVTVCDGKTCRVIAPLQTIAQMKAERQAREGRCYHVGGSFGGGTAEGVGFSSVSADHAIRSCCFWGRKTAIQIGVARGARGWYACVLYR